MMLRELLAEGTKAFGLGIPSPAREMAGWSTYSSPARAWFFQSGAFGPAQVIAGSSTYPAAWIYGIPVKPEAIPRQGDPAKGMAGRSTSGRTLRSLAKERRDASQPRQRAARCFAKKQRTRR